MKYFLALILLYACTTTAFSQYGDSTPKPYMNAGLMLNPAGIEMGMFFIPKSAANTKGDAKSNSGAKTMFRFMGGYGWFAAQDGSGSYEDYTSVLGTVNVYEDRFDGEFSITDHLGLGGYFFTSVTENNKFFLLHQIGLIFYRESFFNKYYDSYEILGDNGRYYTESRTPDNKSTGFEFGTNLFIALSQENSSYYNYFFWYGYLGGSYSTIDSITFRGGVALSFF